MAVLVLFLKERADMEGLVKCSLQCCALNCSQGVTEVKRLLFMWRPFPAFPEPRYILNWCSAACYAACPVKHLLVNTSMAQYYVLGAIPSSDRDDDKIPAPPRGATPWV